MSKDIIDLEEFYPQDPVSTLEELYFQIFLLKSLHYIVGELAEVEKQHAAMV